MWSFDDIAESVSAALETREQSLRAEQAVYGLDAMKELELHALIADGLVDGPWGVLREQTYPHEWTLKRSSETALPERRDRQRCDIVLTEQPKAILDDAVLIERQRRADRSAMQGTLFAGLAPPASVRPANAVPPEDALWIELKVIAQHTLTAGVLVPNRTYTTALTRGPLSDLAKLRADDRIHAGAAVVVLFVQTRDTASHDLSVLTHRCLDKALPIASPAHCGFPITERIGNAWCAVCVIGITKI